MSEFIKVVFKRQIVLTALKVALVVGSLLNLINQGEQLFSGQGIMWGQLALNFIVPYCVASYSAAKNDMARNQEF